MNWTDLLSSKRLGQENLHRERMDDRSEFQRDYDRLIFSSPFRRMQNKTQVFPLPGSVFVHNRLTHSIEVSSVGRSLSSEVISRLTGKHPELRGTHFEEIGSIVSSACLAHDMGNPPFGHSGEKAIATYFSERGGLKFKQLMTHEEWDDIIHFEGNANAFRLLTHQFEGRRAGGFVLTYSTLASIVKYPYESGCSGKKQKFGFFQSEKADFEKIASELGIRRISKEGELARYSRHPLVYLVEAADDICYEIMDLEDAHKLKIISTEETMDLLFGFFDEDRQQRMKENFNIVTDINERIVYLRSCAIGCLVHEAARVFEENEDIILRGEFEGCLMDHIGPRARKAYERIADTARMRIYRSKDVVDVELAGYKVISTLIELMTEAVFTPDKAYSKLLINRVSGQYQIHDENPYNKVMAVLDYISGMTDVFALDLYRKINGNSLPLI